MLSIELLTTLLCEYMLPATPLPSNLKQSMLMAR